MNDLEYRNQFESLDGAHQAEAPSKSHYEQCARQYRSRWKSWLPAQTAATFLDLGCGYGEWLYFLRRQGYTHAVGVDASARKVECAKSMGVANVYRCDVKEFLSESNEQFDVVTAFNFFEHLSKEELLNVLQLIHRVLRPEGRLLAITPNGLSPFSGATRYWDFTHEQSFTPASWRQIGAISGFEEMYFEEYGPMPHSVMGAIRVVSWFCIRLLIQFANYVEVGSARGEKVYTADMKIILFKK